VQNDLFSEDIVLSTLILLQLFYRIVTLYSPDSSCLTEQCTLSWIQWHSETCSDIFSNIA